MVWTIRFDADAERDFRKLDRFTQERLFDYLTGRIAHAEDPRLFGKPLRGGLAGLWRYRVGDYRILCRIVDQTMTVLVIGVGHRRNIYDA